ncbi:DNA repair exonuclease [Sporolactobacillus sp. THM7-4]|nr:DNA repair exonuclease [Sporolactobacillus sp. THM7-4]
MIRFIHAADLHLDRPFEGLSELPQVLHERVKQSTFKALDRLVERTLAEHADFLILAGDIFDDSHRSLLAQKRFVLAMKRLETAGVPVFSVFGNHDHLDDPWNRMELPGNVHVFPTEPAMIPYIKADGQVVHLYGFSYAQRRIEKNMAADYEPAPGADYHIGILHGALSAGNQDDRYAPFSIHDLISKNFDYWALGHIHKREQLSPPNPIWYSGDTQGLSIKETGEKGASLVELDKGGARVTFLSTADILWKKKKIDLTGKVSAEQLSEVLEEARENARSDEHGVFLSLDLSVSETDQKWSDFNDMLEELLDVLKDGEEERADFVWPVSADFTLKPKWDRERLMESSHFIGDLLRLMESDEGLNDALSPLYQHYMGKRFLKTPDENEEVKIRQDAEQILVDALLPAKSARD